MGFTGKFQDVHGKRAAPLAALVLSVALVASRALGQVMEIGADGDVVTYRGPAVYSTEGVSPIQSARSPAVASVDLKDTINRAALRYELDPQLVEAVAWTESRFHQNAISPKGAVGVMQLMDGTARGLGVDRFDVTQNIEGGTAYLRSMLDRYGGSAPLALAAYNAGPGRVDRSLAVPQIRETQSYVRTILARWSQSGASPAVNAFQPLSPKPLDLPAAPSVIFVDP